MGYNFINEGIPNHPDFLALSNVRPWNMAIPTFEIAKHVYPDKAYAKDMIDRCEHVFEVEGDTVTIDYHYEFDTFDISPTEEVMGTYQVYWFGNDLLFYIGDTYLFQLGAVDALSYGANKVSTYQLLLDHINVKDHYNHIRINGCCALDYKGPWTPYFTYFDDGYTAIVAQNHIIEAKYGNVDYNERYTNGKK